MFWKQLRKLHCNLCYLFLLLHFYYAWKNSVAANFQTDPVRVWLLRCHGDVSRFAGAVRDASWRRVVWHLRRFTNILSKKGAQYQILTLSGTLSDTSPIQLLKVSQCRHQNAVDCEKSGLFTFVRCNNLWIHCKFTWDFSEVWACLTICVLI